MKPSLADVDLNGPSQRRLIFAAALIGVAVGTLALLFVLLVWSDGPHISRPFVLGSALVITTCPIGAYLLVRNSATFALGLTKSHATDLGQSALGLVQALVPSTVANEEIGDALERICRLKDEGHSRWRIRLVVLTTILWLFVNSARAYGRAIMKRMG